MSETVLPAPAPAPATPGPDAVAPDLTTAEARIAPAVSAQAGERCADIDRAWYHGHAAVTELGMTAQLRGVPATDPGAWHCTLYRDGRPVPRGDGAGKGTTAEVARVGAVFEALEHHLSMGVPPAEHVRARPAHQLADPGDAALALLARGPDRPLGCLPYRSLHDDRERDLPIFLSNPGYLVPAHTTTRVAHGDTYDYAALGRYSVNSGWAAGTTPDEALVHALNEIVERDAMSLLLVTRFLTRTPAPLRVVRPATLPPDLAALHRQAEDRLGTPVWLLDMTTTDLRVPAYWAYTPAPPGRPARIRGCGASLSARYAAERALTELIQIHSITTHEPGTAPHRIVQTEPYPPLHRAYLAELTPDDTTTWISFTDTPAPGTPADHLATLTTRLHHAGYTAWAWQRHHTGHLAVLNVCVPGLERFVLVTDGQLVLPGPRARGLSGETD
ncbi:YcaO-like family protein [Amycolatopsis magusensis]|uniref:YcaO-like family protein n=1 Tax=Amycolatopsis magusensis TaxID=882444 RepID=UPI0037B7D66E